MLKMSCWVHGSCKLPFGATAFLTTDLDMDLKLQTSNSGGARGKEVGDFKCSQEADRACSLPGHRSNGSNTPQPESTTNAIFFFEKK